MRLGVFLPTTGLQTVSTTARHAEDVGFESVWVVDQLIAGTGAPMLDSGIALATAAAVTTRIRLGFGVLILPLRPVAWAAKQVASLQHVSGDRVLLGVGVGGDRHDRSWAAVGVPRRERGRRTDAALRVLPGLIAGEPVELTDQPGSPTVQLAPAATVPPILVGGMSDAALVRTARHADGWLGMVLPPATAAEYRARLATLAEAEGRPAPEITVTLMAAVTGDPALPDRTALTARLTDPDGKYAIPADAVSDLVVYGDPEHIATTLAAYAEAGVDRVIVESVGGDWFRQTELMAKAATLVR